MSDTISRIDTIIGNLQPNSYWGEMAECDWYPQLQADPMWQRESQLYQSFGPKWDALNEFVEAYKINIKTINSETSDMGDSLESCRQALYGTDKDYVLGNKLETNVQNQIDDFISQNLPDIDKILKTLSLQYSAISALYSQLNEKYPHWEDWSEDNNPSGPNESISRILHSEIQKVLY